VTKALQRFLDFAAPLPPEKEKHQLKQQLVRNTITEIGFVTLCTGLSCYFSVSNELRWAFIKQGIKVVAVNVTARAVAMGCRYAAITERGLFLRAVNFGVDCVAPLNFAWEFKALSSLVHEGGHAISAYVLLQRSKIEIIATHLNWVTHYVGSLSKVGSYLGEFRVRMVICAAGSLATVFTNQIALIAALYLKNSYPELSKYLLLQPIVSLCNEINYAWSAFDTAKASPTHDFLYLWKEGGIHPYLSIVTMIALPTISTLSFLGLRYRC
jgi:hypothetical protein